MARTIQLIGSEKLKRNIAEISKHYPEQLGKALLAEILKILRISNRKIKVDTGATRASQYSELEVKPNNITAEGGYKSNVALWLDQDTRPHMPPIQPLKEWAWRKGLAKDEEDAERIAWGVAKIIQRFGTKGDFFFTNTVNEERANVERELGKFILEKQNELARRVK